MMDRRIGAQMFTIRDFCKTAEDLDASCKKLHDMGFELVQSSGVCTTLSGAELKEIYDRHSLTPVVTHRGYNEYTEDIDNMIKFHKDLGCPVAGMGAMPKELKEDMNLENLKKFISTVNKISEEMKKENITFAYHNHAFDWAKVDGKPIFEYFIEECDVSFILDVYWLSFVGKDPADFIDRIGKKAIIAHYKDLKANLNNTVEFCEVGNGLIDFDKVTAACDRAGTIAAFIEQDKCDGDPFESLKISRDYLVKKGFN